MADRDNIISVRPVHSEKEHEETGFPPVRRYGEEVPKGGSMCANCEYLSDDKKHCKNKAFVAWKGPDKPAGSNVIPKPADRYCSIFWEGKK